MVGSRNCGLTREAKEIYGANRIFSSGWDGLNKPITIKVDQLDVKDAEELKRLVDASRFFDLPTAIGVPAKGMADYQFYTLAISDSDHQHSVRVLDLSRIRRY